MKKRIFGLLLVAIMIIPMVLTGCQSSGYVSTRGSSATPYTITIWCITDDKTTQDGIEAAEEAINSITEYDFNTHIELRLFSADEYENEVRSALDTMSMYYEEPEETESAETTVNDDGEVEEVTESKVYVERDKIVYPDSTDYQCDILLIDSVDFFAELVANEDIQVLDGELAGNSKAIYKYENPTLLAAGKDSMTGATYAIANNGAVSDAEYILLRKDICDALYYEASDIHTLATLKEYASDASSYGVTPVLDTYGVEPLYESMFEGDSFVGAYIGYKPSLATNAMPKALGSVNKYTNELGIISSMKSSGQLVSGEIGENPTAAAILVKGNSADIAAYTDDYYVSYYKYPTASNENTCSSMWAVSTYTKDVSRCMEIVTYMQTNEDFINTFYYGKSGVNYERDSKTGVVTILNDEYSMDMRYVGNQFLIYQNDRMTESELAFSEDSWAMAKEFNLNLIASPYLGFSAEFTQVYYEDEEGMSEYTKDGSTSEFIAKFKEISASYAQKLASYTGSDIATYAATLADEMSENYTVKAALSKKYTNSPFAKYVAWFKLNNAEETE